MRRVPIVIVVMLWAATACGSPDQGSGQRPEELYLDFNAAETGSPIATVHNYGTAEVKTEVATSGKQPEEIVGAPGYGSKGQAARFPLYSDAPDASAAVLVVTPSDAKGLAPGKKDFTFGAAFNVDEQSEGTDVDNGNNLVQRGIFEGPGQYKLQVDGGLVSCRVLGDDGEVFVQTPDRIAPSEWYTVTCTRTADELVLRVRTDPGGTGAGTWRKDGHAGNVDVARVPFTVGGKADENGTLLSSPDQFNGVVDNVFFEILK